MVPGALKKVFGPVLTIGFFRENSQAEPVGRGTFSAAMTSVSGEKFCLTWKDFQASSCSAFQVLRGMSKAIKFMYNCFRVSVMKKISLMLPLCLVMGNKFPHTS